MAATSRQPVLSLRTNAERETALLAPYAMFSSDSAGRKHPEPQHPYRGPYQRDRDRILHSGAYRRLSGKTQVFTNMGDYHRTRLTHTQEVASISRTIGRALRLNEDLIEALALLHDIGHPPYGHAGEDALNECLVDEGGFSHNQHALTIAEELEIRYPHFQGLNLSLEVLEGQASRVAGHVAPTQPLLEVQVVDTADSITYDAHDTDDAIKLGILSLDELATIPLVRQLLAKIYRRNSYDDDEQRRLALVHELIEHQVSDVLRYSGELLADSRFASSTAARQSDFVLGPSAELRQQKEELERFLYERVYRHPRLLQVRSQAQQRLKRIFTGFLNEPSLLPPRIQLRIDQVGLRRTVGEYVAGMTDHYCDRIYEQQTS